MPTRDLTRNPDELLDRIRRSEQAEGKGLGRLKIFFGYAAGVGKTYAMLKEAHAAKAKGVDVVVGYVEPHQRPETTALLEGLECLPALELDQSGIIVRELDIDGVLRRRPQVVLVDELAHANADGCRHKKRFQDVEELLRAGIDVYTTVNVQHLESLNDKVAAITHVTVRERVPDRVFDYASSVELVDIEPDELIERLGQGKIYQESTAKAALSNFFTKKNLAALREIALRRTADRLARNPRAAGTEDDAPGACAGDDVLVYLTADRGNPRVIRAAANLAAAYHAHLIAFVVEGASSGNGSSDEDEGEWLQEHIELAESLGAHTVTVSGDDAALQISLYAPTAGVSHVVVGASLRVGGRLPFGRPLTQRLMRLAPDTTVVAVPDLDEPHRIGRSFRTPLLTPTPKDAALSVGAIGLATMLGLALSTMGISESVVMMLYLVTAMFVALLADSVFFGLAAAVLAVVSLNFFFTPPRFSFVAYGADAPFVFLFMLMATLAVSTLTLRVKRQGEVAARRAYRTEILLESDRKLQEATDLDACFEVGARQILKFLNRPVVMYRCRDDGHVLEPVVYDAPGTVGSSAGRAEVASASERAVADWAALNNERAGSHTDTLASAQCYYLPIHAKDRVFGVVGLALGVGDDDEFGAFEENLLLAILDALGQAAEQVELSRERQDMQVKAKAESLRFNLLRSVSHDLRTPLTSISGDAGMLIESSAQMDEAQRQRLYADMYNDAVWLKSLVENLLSITRVEEGGLDLRMEPQLVSEVVEEALRHVSHRADRYDVRVDIPDVLLMARMDERLIVQVIVNLVNNALAYTPEGSSIVIKAARRAEEVVVSVVDDGPGLVGVDRERMFDLFYTGPAKSADSRRGMGLGLALCRSIVEAHGGAIDVVDTDPHGCTFRFTLPACG